MDFPYFRFMKFRSLWLAVLLIVLLAFDLRAQRIITGAEQVSLYLPWLKNKEVALLVNQTSMIGEIHLVDSLIGSGVKIVKIFAPEHGFRGTADAGEKVKNSIDVKTGIPITSMYGASKKPSKESMSGIDIVVFDIQDVGARFYTYISSLQYMMEACAEANVPIVVLDRPNPNGHYVDGPILDKKHKSFVGMQAIPIVHGMTVAEYAHMLKSEKWLNTKLPLDLKWVTCKNYTHASRYELPIPPSPNLKSMLSIYLYPSLCLFEGAEVSVGRGTERPFEMWGAPDFVKLPFRFTPKSTAGAKSPLFEGRTCYGRDLASLEKEFEKKLPTRINLNHLIEAYQNSKQKDKFFNSFFVKLSGTDTLISQIKSGKSESDIYKSWSKGLSKFKLIRKKYLLYKDFE